MEESKPTATIPAKRPVFITVLCILSFVGIGLNLAMSLYDYYSSSALAELNGPQEGMFGAVVDQMSSAFDIDYGKIATSDLVIAFLDLPLLLAVLLMWKQRKSGFYIYASAELVQAISPLIIVGGLSGGFTSILYIIVAITFTVLYGVNLKHLS
jgi:hypothetical protein